MSWIIRTWSFLFTRLEWLREIWPCVFLHFLFTSVKLIRPLCGPFTYNQILKNWFQCSDKSVYKGKWFSETFMFKIRSFCIFFHHYSHVTSCMWRENAHSLKWVVRLQFLVSDHVDVLIGKYEFLERFRLTRNFSEFSYPVTRLAYDLENERNIENLLAIPFLTV